MSEEIRTNSDRQRFTANLPWYLNGGLSGNERIWMDQVLQKSPWASNTLAIERELINSISAPDPADADLGLKSLLARVQGEQRASTLNQPSWVHRLADWLAQPRLAMAMSVLVVTQATVIGYVALAPGSSDDTGMRSTPVTEVRTLRVSFVPDVSESRLRGALQAAGARVVGGPTQLGEYWLASDIRSLDEMKAALLASGLTRSIEVDLAGPHGR